MVTLAGLLFWEGLTLKILGSGGSVLISDSIVNDIASGNLSPIAGWVVMLVIVGLFGVLTWRRDARRRTAGLVAPPPGLTALKIGGGLVGGVVIVLICNTDRGRILPIQGVPWVVVLVFGILAAWTFVLGRTRFGRYVYAIGGNAEAARRAGVNLRMIRTVAFTLCSFTAGMAGVIYASRLRSISTAFDQTLVLYAVAAAVIGGTSLFGGRGKALHGVLGGVVIAAIANGMGLLGLSARLAVHGHGAGVAHRGDDRRAHASRPGRGDVMVELGPGDPAPGFALRNQSGQVVRLEDYRGQKLLVYFYPEADTPGCTTQSCDLRDHRQDLGAIGVDVVGISPDDPDKQLAFDRKYGLGFPLLADEDHAVADAWGTWGPKTRGGVTVEGIIRSSFLVDEQGNIERAWYGVTPKDTVPNALAALSS